MPNWFPSWTKCCDPANYRALPLGAMIAIGSVGLLLALGAVSYFVYVRFWRQNRTFTPMDAQPLTKEAEST